MVRRLFVVRCPLIGWRPGSLSSVRGRKCGLANFAEITSFLSIHKERCGKEPGRLALSVQAEVDVLQFHSVADEATGINIGEALRTAATRER